MPKQHEGTLEEQWEKMIRWMRMLPVWFRLAHVPIIGKHLFKDSFVGDPTAHNWMIPVNRDLSSMGNLHFPMDVLRPMIERAAACARAPRCICRDSFRCETYPVDVACLALGSAFTNAEEAGMIPLSKEEALAHAERALALGLVPTVIWDNDVELFGGARETGVVVCLCCDCCCDVRLGLRRGTDEFRKKVFRPEGVSLVVSDACKRCGTCAEPDVCSVHAIHLGPEKSIIDLDLCVGCSHCVQVCPEKAISFVIDPEVDVVGRLIARVESVTNIT